MGLQDVIAVCEQDPKIRIVASKDCWCTHIKLQCAESIELFGVMLWAEHYLESTTQIHSDCKYSNDNVMPLDGVRKAEGRACESLATGAQRQLRALQRLYPPLADDMVVRGQVPTIGSSK